MLSTVLLTALLPFGFAGASLSSLASAYRIQDLYIGRDFLERFDHEAIPDPTHGRVNYVDKSTAIARNLTFTSKDTLILRADSSTILNPNGPGRNSVRIISKKQYTTSVTVVDLRHMPVGCATWPALWTTSNSVPWPAAGEIDILEGVNDVGPNAATLHTSNGCTMSAANMQQTGNLVNTNCFVGANFNSGCGVQSNKAASYGKKLNDAGGGWYAMERTSTHISVWFWARNEPSENVPQDVRLGFLLVNPERWGTPFAHFPNDSCDIRSKFGPNNLIINLTFCGDWAGNVYPSTCPQSCVDHVNRHPEAFKDAYWDIASIRVYSSQELGTNVPSQVEAEDDPQFDSTKASPKILLKEQ